MFAMEWMLPTVTAVLAIAWFTTHFLVRRPVSRDLVWRMTLCVVAMTPLLYCCRSALSNWRLPVALLPAVQTPNARASISDGPTDWSNDRKGTFPELLRVSEPANDVIVTRTPSSPQIENNAAVSNSERLQVPLSISWSTIMCSLWLAGVFVQLTRIGFGLWNTYRLIHSADAVTDERALYKTKQAAKRIGLSKAPLLLTCSRLDSPVVAGIWRPRILVPAELIRPENGTPFRSALLHECGHVRRHDVTYELLLKVVLAVFWFHPLVHVMSSQLRRLREEICDNYVLAEESPVSYAETLLQLAVGQRLTGNDFVGLGMFSKYRLADRVDALLDPKRPRDTVPSRWTRSLALFVMSVFVLAVTSVRLEHAKANEPIAGVSKEPEVATRDVTKTPEPKSNANSPSSTRSFHYRVVNSSGEPVVGAKVQPVGFFSRSGDPYFDEKYRTVSHTDSLGNVHVVFTDEMDKATTRMLGESGTRRMESVRLSIEHPDHPFWDDHVPVGSDQPIVLPDSTKIVVRAHLGNETKPATRLYPLVSGGIQGLDWAQDDNGLTITKLNTSSPKGAHRLRIVHLPESGPAWFSTVVDLQQLTSIDVSLDLALKPGVGVRGRLADNVPRPVKNGRVMGVVVSGTDRQSNQNLQLTVNTEIKEDGTFFIESLPTGETLQLFAVCDGWASRSPDMSEVQAFGKKHGLTMDGLAENATSLFLPNMWHLVDTEVVMEIPMEPAAAIEVAVTDDKDRPLADVEVRALLSHYVFNGWFPTYDFDSFSYIRDQLATPGSVKESQARVERYSVKTNKQGQGVFANLPDSRDRSVVQLLVAAEGYLAVPNGQYPPGIEDWMVTYVPAITATLRPGETEKVAVKMRPIPNPSELAKLTQPLEEKVLPDELAGTVTDMEGNPLEGVRVRLGDMDDFEVLTDKSGRYRRRFPELAEEVDVDRLPVCFRKEGFAPAIVQCRFGTSDTRVTLDRKTYFEGVVYKPDGTVAPNVLVRAHQLVYDGMLDELWTETRTDGQGRYKLLVQTGEFVVTVNDPAMGTAWLPKWTGDKSKGEKDSVYFRPRRIIYSGEAARLDIQLQPGVQLKIKVLDGATGKPVEGVLLSLAEYFLAQNSVQTDETGRGTLPMLPPEECTVTLHAKGYSRARSEQASPRWKEIIRTKEITATQMDTDGVVFDLTPGMEEVTIHLER